MTRGEILNIISHELISMLDQSGPLRAGQWVTSLPEERLYGGPAVVRHKS